MEPTNVIEYRGQQYPVFSLTLNIDGEPYDAEVGTESLDKALRPNGEYADLIAVNIDNTLFFFIPDDMTDKSEEEIIQYIEKNL